MIVQADHARSIPMTAHATNRKELKRSLDAGVDDVAHIYTDSVPNRIIQRMASMGVYWVPTLEVLNGEGQENLLRFMQAGGNVAMGTDAGYMAGLKIGSPLDEFTLMQQKGITAMEIIEVSTRNSACMPAGAAPGHTQSRQAGRRKVYYNQFPSPMDWDKATGCSRPGKPGSAIIDLDNARSPWLLTSLRCLFISWFSVFLRTKYP